MQLKIKLKPRDRLVSREENRQADIRGIPAELVASHDTGCSGWYAIYPEGVFIVLLNEADDVVVSWKGKIVSIDDAVTIRWKSGFKGRCFQVHSTDSGLLLEADYQTFWRYMRNPFLLLADVFVPDDDWGLVADLPSFVHSAWDRGNLVSCLRKLKEGSR